MTKDNNTINSAAVIAQLLGVEGYSDFVHNQVERYWRRRVMDHRRANRVLRIERDFSKMVEELDLTEGDRLLLGKFIGLRAQMSFDTGLRIGLMAFLKRQELNGHEHGIKSTADRGLMDKPSDFYSDDAGSIPAGPANPEAVRGDY